MFVDLCLFVEFYKFVDNRLECNYDALYEGFFFFFFSTWLLLGRKSGEPRKKRKEGGRIIWRKMKETLTIKL